MIYRYYRPDMSIAAYVRTVLVLEEGEDTGATDLPLFTNGSPALLCSIEKNTSVAPALFGQSVPSEKWIVGNNTVLIAFFFKPFVLGTIFGIAAKTLKERPMPLAEWNPQKAIAINLQLLNTHATDERITILTELVAKQVAQRQYECNIIMQATDEIMTHPETEILTTLLSKLNITERTFQRIFKKYVGITPGQYRRICQFYFAFAQLKGKHFEKLADVAYHNGYYDQSHYIRSFKEFTHTTPQDYMQWGLTRKNE